MKYLILISALLATPVHAFEDLEWWGGVGWTHFSHLDVGPPWNDKPESFVDHFGFKLEARWDVRPEGYWYGGVGIGSHNIINNCDCYENGGAWFDTRIDFGYQWRLK